MLHIDEVEWRGAHLLRLVFDNGVEKVVDVSPLLTGPVLEPLRNPMQFRQVRIDPLAVLRGRFPRRALGMVFEWAAMHQQELLDNWERLQNDQAPERIDPLD